VYAEYGIAGTKRSRCLKDELRNTQPDCSDAFMAFVASWHNLRVRHRKRRLRRWPAFLFL